MWSNRETTRRLTLFASAFVLMLTLSGCREISTEPSDYARNVASYESWEVRATWVWETSGERMMTIRGLGSWKRGGEIFRLKEQMLSTSITTSTENGDVVLEDGTRYEKDSPQARYRIERSLFSALDPLKLAEHHGIDLRVDEDTLVGEGPCRGGKPGCRFSIELHVDSAHRPTQVRTVTRNGDQAEIVDWAYGKNLSIAWA